MKKNVMMRVAAVLLVCVLASTCGISGTFAKYVTQGTSNDSARVAKFGVTITADGDLFSDSYKDSATVYTDPETGNAITVQADTQDTNIVAPGTEGSLAIFTVTGTPEVDVTVTFANPTVDFGDKWVGKNGNFYCPITIKISTNAGTTTVNGLDFNNVDDFEDAIVAAIEGAQGYYDANTNLNTVNDDLQISWSWAFEGATGSVRNQDNVDDTFLGDEAAKGNAATISISVTCVISQVN